MLLYDASQKFLVIWYTSLRSLYNIISCMCQTKRIVNSKSYLQYTYCNPHNSGTSLIETHQRFHTNSGDFKVVCIKHVFRLLRFHCTIL